MPVEDGLDALTHNDDRVSTTMLAFSFRKLYIQCSLCRRWVARRLLPRKKFELGDARERDGEPRGRERSDISYETELSCDR